MFLTRLFGSEGLSGVADAKEAAEAARDDLDSLRAKGRRGSVCEKSAGLGDEHWAELKQQVLDLTLVSALQRQLQMQGEVSQVAAAIERRLDEVASVRPPRRGDRRGPPRCAGSMWARRCRMSPAASRSWSRRFWT